MATPRFNNTRAAIIRKVIISTRSRLRQHSNYSCRSSSSKPQLCLLGAPGSGKGSYGKILAQHWGVPLITVSDVLKQQMGATSKDDMSSGKLVDDDFVSQALLNHFAEQQSQRDTTATITTTSGISSSITATNGYILDGFPRTIQQVQLMQDKWPASLQIQAAVHLKVPPSVCERKLLGRRFCTICGNHYNVNGVLFDGFDLPPKLPRAGGSDCHRSLHQRGVTHASLPQQHTLANANKTAAPKHATLRSSTGLDDDIDKSCDPATARHWKQREDDTQEIIHHRLELYTQHTEPILSHFQEQQTLFQFVPYKGFDDMPKFQSQLEEWVSQKFPER